MPRTNHWCKETFIYRASQHDCNKIWYRQVLAVNSKNVIPWTRMGRVIFISVSVFVFKVFTFFMWFLVLFYIFTLMAILIFATCVLIGEERWYAVWRRPWNSPIIWYCVSLRVMWKWSNDLDNTIQYGAISGNCINVGSSEFGKFWSSDTKLGTLEHLDRDIMEIYK